MNLNKALKAILIFFSSIGIIGCLSIYLLFFFGETSKERRKMIFKSFNSFVGIGKKFDGFVANTPEKIIKRYYFYFLGKFKSFPYDSLNIEINLENLKKLEKMRSAKFNDESLKQVASKNQFVNARVTLFNNNKNLNKKLKVKIRPKGDRNLHFLNLDSMSYKLDVRGKNEFIYGMEEMSIQKPIVRNYAWEILYHQIIKDNDILGLKLIPIKLYRNSEYLGIYVIEEGFSKELLEKQSRKNGPIIGIDESFSHKFPNLKYEYYSKNFWLEKNRDIFFKSKNHLDDLKINFDQENFQFDNFFDTQKWAKFFAISDLLKMFHGTVPKSVKLYYNPTSGLFEPIAFDGHFLSGYDNFSFIDYIYDPTIECGYACEHKNWLSLFFNKNNRNFIEEYLFFLKKFTSEEYISKIKKIHDNEIQEINQFFYSEYQSSDRAFFKGVLPYYFDLNVLFERSKKINLKIPFVENYLKNYYLDQKNLKKITKNNNSDINLNQKNITIPKGTWVLENVNLKNKNIFFEENSILVLNGINSFIGESSPFNFSGKGMIVQKNGDLKLSNVNFSNLENIKIRGMNWSGSINIINSNLKIKDVNIVDNLGEDSINIVNSNSIIENLIVSNSFSDSVDVDFGQLSFSKITCNISGNDCLDISGADVIGEQLIGNNVKDKLGSFGERSKVEINTVSGSNTFIGVVSKDSSKVNVKNLLLNKTNIHAASYNKKFFFEDSVLKIDKLTLLDEKNIKKILVSKGNKILLKNQVIKNFTKNKKILDQIYFK